MAYTKLELGALPPGFFADETEYGMSVYTTNQFEGAPIKNDTPIVKAKESPGDKNRIGTTGVVIGSLDAGEGRVGYFVRWDSEPHIPVFVSDFKIQAR